jgi:hypothetical protein
MSTEALLVYCGFAAALFLFFAASQSRGLAVIAVVASGLQVLEQLHVLQLRIGRVPAFILPLALALGLAVPALLSWFRSTVKSAVTASAIATLVGAVQVLGLFGRLPK